MVDAKQAVISAVTVLSKRIDTFASSLEKFCQPSPSSDPSPSTGHSSPLSGLLPQNTRFAPDCQLDVISWNICGITSHAKLAQLKTYVFCQYPSVIFTLGSIYRPATSRWVGIFPRRLCSMVSLFTYIHKSLPHHLLRTSSNPDITCQLFLYGRLKCSTS